MDFSLTEEQQAVRDLFRDFATREIQPIAEELDRSPRFPKEIFAQAAELGFFAMRYPEAADGCGGGGMDNVSFLLAVRELARGSLGVAAALTMQALMGTNFVHMHAKGELRHQILKPALQGKLLGTICMTEPGAGSDLFSMSTSAVERDGSWYLTGQKTWITSATFADMFTVFARTGEKEISIFLVLKDAPGLVVGKAIEKMGVRASLTSELSFENTRAVCMLGEQGAGIPSVRKILGEIRLMTAALALGIADAAIEEAVRYSKEREQFGKPICRFQAIQTHLAEMKTEHQAAESLMLWACWMGGQGGDNADAAAMAKLKASEMAVEVCDRACRIFASYGYASEYPVERYLRDARFTLIGGGTSEILKVNIARGMTR
jgi:benzylmalonyl-CoA dehydrogenase